MHWYRIRESMIRLDQLRYAEKDGKVILLVFLDGAETRLEFGDSRQLLDAFQGLFAWINQCSKKV